MVPAHESACCSYSAQVQLCEHQRKRDADAGKPSPFLLPSTTQMSDAASAQYLANVYYKALQKAATKTATLKRQLAIKHEENHSPLPKVRRQGGCVVCNSVAGVNLLKCRYCPQHCPFPSCCVKSHRKQKTCSTGGAQTSECTQHWAGWFMRWLCMRFIHWILLAVMMPVSTNGAADWPTSRGGTRLVAGTALMCMKVDNGRIGACSRHVLCGEVVHVSYLCCPEFAACFEQGFSWC